MSYLNRETYRSGTVLAGLFLSVTATLGGEPSELVRSQQVLGGRADWVAVDGGQVAFGSGRRLVLARETPSLVVHQELQLNSTVVEAVLVGNDLYASDGRVVRLLDLESSPIRQHTVQMIGETRGGLHLARMTDYLVVAEDGVGLRFVQLRVPPGVAKSSHMGHGPSESRQVAFHSLPLRINAVTTFDTLVYAATDDGAIVLVDLADADHPTTRSIQFAGTVRGMAATRTRLYVLASDGLSVLDLSSADRHVVDSHPSITGRDLRLTGRTLLVAAEETGLLAFQDQSAALAVVDVTVGSNFFSPDSVTVNINDMVRWSKTTGVHNVESCNGSQAACAGASANETFRSGDATGTAFTYTYRFTATGANPYICIVHGGFGMVGSVTVAGACDDGIACTTDSGTPGNCVNTPNNAACDNNNSCDGEETCSAISGCQSGTPLNCDDGVGCTSDSCSAANGCSSTPQDALCNNSDVCDGVETCDAVNDCQTGVPLDCVDAVACTDDSCNAASGCVNSPNDAACDNGELCDGTETCNPASGCELGTPLSDGDSCADGDVCNGDETCASSVCNAGIALPDSDTDGVCDLIDVCLDDPDPNQENLDGDAFGDACDCAPADDLAWGLPNDATGLTLSHTGGLAGTTTVVWSAPTILGGSAVLYDTLRSTDAADFVSTADCVESGDVDTVTLDSLTPASNVVHFILTRASTVCGNGGLGTQSNGTPRVGLSCP